MNLCMERSLGRVVARHRRELLNLTERVRHANERDRDIGVFVVPDSVDLVQESADELGCLRVALGEVRLPARGDVNDDPVTVSLGLDPNVIDGVGVGLERDTDHRQFIGLGSASAQQYVGEVAGGDPVREGSSAATAGVRVDGGRAVIRVCGRSRLDAVPRGLVVRHAAQSPSVGR
jgi:hypothetical protein